MSSKLFSLDMDQSTKEAYLSVRTADIRAIRAIRQTFYWLGKDLYGDSRTLIKRGRRTGRTYRYKGRRYKASAPGEPPQRVSGKLRASMKIKVQGAQSLTFGATAKYASDLEEGTPKMAQRPFLKVTVEKNRQNALNIGEREFNKEFGQ